jgi:hypothetical protein
MDNGLIIRDALPEDAERLVEIYSHYVLNTAVSFEYTVPSVHDFTERIRKTKEKYPWLVCEKKVRSLAMRMREHTVRVKHMPGLRQPRFMWIRIITGWEQDPCFMQNWRNGCSTGES